MAKITTMQKEQFQICRDVLRDAEMRVFFSRDLRMMVGIMSDGVMDNGLIYRMFVTLCHPNDEFKKKLGLIHLCEAYDNDNFNRVRVHSNIKDFVCEYMRLTTISQYQDFDLQEMELN